MPSVNKWFANPLQAQSVARAGVPAGGLSRQSQTNRPALARNVAAGQQASAGPAGMATAGYRAAGQGVPPTSPNYGSQSNLQRLDDMSAGPNDPLFGDQFDMSQNAGTDDGMSWGGPLPIGGPQPQPNKPRPNTPWMPGDPRPSPYQRPTGGPQPTQPTTPGLPAPWMKGGGGLFGQTTGTQQQGGQVPFDQRGPGLGGISREEAASSPFKGWNALGGQQAVSSLEGHRASQEARATGQTPFNQRGPGKSVGVMGSPGAQGQPGPGGGYNPQSDVGGFFGSPQPPPMSGQPGPGGGYDPQSDVGGFFGNLERQQLYPQMPVPTPVRPGPDPTPPAPAPLPQMRPDVQNIPPLRYSLEEGRRMMEEHDRGVRDRMNPGVQGRPPLITPAKPVVPHGFDPASGLGPEIGSGTLPTGAPQSWGPEEDALRAGQGGFFPYEFPPGPAGPGGSNLGNMSSAANRVPVSSPVPPSTPAQYIGGAPRRRGAMAGDWRGMV